MTVIRRADTSPLQYRLTFEIVRERVVFEKVILADTVEVEIHRGTDPPTSVWSLPPSQWRTSPPSLPCAVFRDQSAYDGYIRPAEPSSIRPWACL